MLDFVTTMWYYIRGLDKNPQTKQRKNEVVKNERVQTRNSRNYKTGMGTP